MKIAIRRIGNSRGMIIPTPVLAQLGLEDEAEVTIKDGAMIVRAAKSGPRAGWAAASKALAAEGDDGLVMPEFANADDAELAW